MLAYTLGAGADRLQQLGATAAQAALAEAADLLQFPHRGGTALGELDQRRVGKDALHGAVLRGRGPLAPGDQLARDRLRDHAQVADAGQAREDRPLVALVAGFFDRTALLTGPLQTA